MATRKTVYLLPGVRFPYTPPNDGVGKRLSHRAFYSEIAGSNPAAVPLLVLAVTLILLASPSLADDLPAIGIDGSPPCTLQNFGKSPCTMSTISIGDALLDDDIKLHFKHESLTRGYFVFEPYQMQLLREIKGLRTELADLQRDASGHLKYLCKRNTCK